MYLLFLYVVILFLNGIVFSKFVVIYCYGFGYNRFILLLLFVNLEKLLIGIYLGLL